MIYVTYVLELLSINHSLICDSLDQFPISEGTYRECKIKLRLYGEAEETETENADYR